MRFEEDTLFRHSLAEHFVLGFEKLILASQALFSGTSKQKQQGLENLTHGHYDLILKAENGS